ncbi:ATP-binding protein [Spongiibacter taiwanensis]|uniref:ATP-binding protein n=1 Tax=Spongiibacter taiwanensis TaxID=1748242 RepID=UPI0020359FF6|nr:ATP-binding protein [Spongiibacter taiwanensis]USA43983.1 ATP-binding protein [Spongiibacter taiwanensis]
MKRFFPGTLKAQSLLLLVALLISSHLLTLFIYERHREESVLLTEAADLAQRIIGVIELANTFADDERIRILQTAQTQFLTAYPEVVPLDYVACQKSAFADEMLKHFKKAFSQRQYQIDVCARSVATLKPFFHTPSNSNALDLLINLQFADQGNASFHALLPHATSLLQDRVLLYLGLVSLISLIFGGLMISRLTSPIRTLGNAATTIGQDLKATPLPEHGPEEIRLAAAAFNTMQHRLQRTLQDQKDMLAAISHDLKSGLTRLQLRAEMLSDEVERQGMEAVVMDMKKMVSSIIDLVRLGNNTGPRQKTNLSYLLDNLVHALCEEGRQISAEIQGDLSFLCNASELQRAVQNLLDNAIKYAGSATLTLSGSGRELRICVCDTGPGIPAERLEDVLKPFVTVDPSRSAATGGQGLGLAIASNIARSHGGNLTLENRSSGGLCATLIFPLDQ